jgi:carbon-monoxide dehydrogenase large subunit
VNASVGLGPSGQGYESAMANAVAEGLGVDPSSVRIHLGHTDIAPYGMGSRGARSGTAGGGALYLCALDARRKVLAIAAGCLDLPDGDSLRLVEARIERRSGDVWVETGLTLADVARRAYMDPTSLPQGLTPGLEFHLTYDPPPMTYSNSTHGCEIELDVATGAIHIARYVIAEDCGTLLNPTVVTGQQHGAVAMGLSGALFEHTRYDETGQNVSGSLADYLIATSTELPNFEIIPLHTPSRATAAGIKGMAEGGVMGALGALTNAVNDALAPFGVVADRHPLTPMLLRDLLRDKL